MEYIDEIELNSAELEAIKQNGIESLFDNVDDLAVHRSFYYPNLLSVEGNIGANLDLQSLYTLPKYTEFIIKKRNGGERIIEIPDFKLKAVQRRILRNILNKINVSNSAVAYVKGKKITDGVVMHVAQPSVLKLDISDFFRSIDFGLVHKYVFSRENIGADASFLLTYLCTNNYHLPQGAPTSPAISNIVLKGFDERVAKFCFHKEINYSRYCDDMTFSGSFDPNDVISFVQNELKAYGLRLNNRKTKYIKQGQRMTVTGIVVNEKMQLSKSYRKRIRQEIYYCKKFGVEKHAERTKQNKFIDDIYGNVNVLEYLVHLYGMVDYALQINPNDKEMRDYYWLLRFNISDAKKKLK